MALGMVASGWRSMNIGMGVPLWHSPSERDTHVIPAINGCSLPHLGRRLLVRAQLAAEQLDPAWPPVVGRVEHRPSLAVGAAWVDRQVARPDLARTVPAPQVGHPV